MPLPTPRKDEKSTDFINRCMRDKESKKDFPDQKQRLAVCFTRLRKKRPSIKRSLLDELMNEFKNQKQIEGSKDDSED